MLLLRALHIFLWLTRRPRNFGIDFAGGSNPIKASIHNAGKTYLKKHGMTFSTSQRHVLRPQIVGDCFKLPLYSNLLIYYETNRSQNSLTRKCQDQTALVLRQTNLSQSTCQKGNSANKTRNVFFGHFRVKLF